MTPVYLFTVLLAGKSSDTQTLITKYCILVRHATFYDHLDSV